MMERLGHWCGVLAISGLVAFGLSGCNPFAPPEDPEPTPPWDYGLRTTPQKVVENLEHAYTEKKAEEYLDCLSEDFVFFLSDDDVTQHGYPEWWDKAEETSIHQHMFSAPEVGTISLTLTLNGDYIEIPGPTPEDPPGWECMQNVDLRVTVGTITYMVNTPSRFRFRIDQDQVGPPPDNATLWEIYEWEDMGGQSRTVVRDDGTMPISMGELKAMFRQ